MTDVTVFAKDLIEALEVAGFRLESIRPEVKQGGRFKPAIGQQYWTITPGAAKWVYIWEDSSFDKSRFARGLTFRTGVEATASDNVQQALVRVQDKLEELTDEPLDWGNIDQPKFHLLYKHKYRNFCISSRQYEQYDIACLYGSESACEWVINNMESDLKLIAGIA